MQLLLLLLAAVVVITVVVMTVLAVVALLSLVAVGAMIGIPTYLFARHWFSARAPLARAQDPLDRLKMLYVEGKIDMFEFERRSAALIAVER